VILNNIIMNIYQDLCSDTSDDDNDDCKFNTILIDHEVKKMCDDFILGKRNISEFDKIMRDNSIETLFGINKFFVGYYCYKRIHLNKKIKKELTKMEESNIVINNNIIIEL
jgi:hypothetical protein